MYCRTRCMYTDSCSSHLKLLHVVLCVIWLLVIYVKIIQTWISSSALQNCRPSVVFVTLLRITSLAVKSKVGAVNTCIKHNFRFANNLQLYLQTTTHACCTGYNKNLKYDNHLCKTQSPGYLSLINIPEIQGVVCVWIIFDIPGISTPSISQVTLKVYSVLGKRLSTVKTFELPTIFPSL